MAGFWSDSDSGSGSGSDYSLDLTASDEERLWAIADRLSPVLPQSRPAPATPATPARPTPIPALARNPIASSPFSPELDPDATLTIQEAIDAITDDDLSFDISELQEDDASPHGQGVAHLHDGASRSSTPEGQNRRPSPSVTGDNGQPASFLARTNPRSMWALRPGPDVDYPDCKLCSGCHLSQIA
jgi:exonuclease V